MTVADGKAASAPGDRRLGRRRQVDADRAPAARRQADPAGHAGRAAPQRHRRRAGPRLDHRRAARRARAGHHDRRRLPLLHDSAALVHHRRHPRPRALHAQHGDRRVDRAARGDPDRRAPRDHRAVAPPCLPLGAARDPPHGRRGQQDGPRRLGRAALPRDRERVLRAGRAARRARRARLPDLGAQRRQRRRARRGGLVRRAAAARAPRGRRRRERARHGAAAAAGAVGDPARGRRARRAPLRRPARRRHAAPGRRGRRAPGRLAHDHHRRRDARRAARVRGRRRTRSACSSPTTSTSAAAS